MKSTVGFVMATGFAFSLGMHAARAATVVAEAAEREAIRQDTTWTSENIQAHPYLFIQDQIAACDRLRAKIEA